MILLDREVRFQIIPNRLYYFDAMYRENRVFMINTVSENREGFTRREYEGAQESRQAVHLLGFLSERGFGNMVRSNMIVNFPVTFDNVKNAKLIFGPDATLLKEKLVRCKTSSVVTEYFEIQQEILKLGKELELPRDIMFVIKIPFLLSITKGLKFTMIEYLSNKS